MPHTSNRVPGNGSRRLRFFQGVFPILSPLPTAHSLSLISFLHSPFPLTLFSHITLSCSHIFIISQQSFAQLSCFHALSAREDFASCLVYNRWAVQTRRNFAENLPSLITQAVYNSMKHVVMKQTCNVKTI